MKVSAIPENHFARSDTLDQDSSSHSAETRRLTRSLTSGSEEAWSDFFQQYHPRLTAYVAVMWRGESSAIDDIVQNTFLRAVRHIRTFDDELIFWNWLTCLARSAVADMGRKRTRRWKLLELIRGNPGVANKNGPATNDDIDTSLAQLPESDRLLLMAKYFDEQSVAEIAGEMNISEKAVESRLTRARRSLRRIMNRITK